MSDSKLSIWDYKHKRVHMVGIGGSSMSGLAEMLHSHGFDLTGSDRSEGHGLEGLRALGLPVYAGHKPEIAAQADLLIFSAAIPKEDPERMAASEKGIPQMERAVLLGQLMLAYDHRLCVAGTHGKTTVSAMLAKILLDCGKDPGVHIGGSLDYIGGGSRVGQRHMIVAEACEFNRSFLHMAPTLAILTNIEEDHLDCYKDIHEIQAVFAQFVSLLPQDGLVIGLRDDPRVTRVMAQSGRRCESFSLTEDADWQAAELAYDERGRARFAVVYQGKRVGHARLQVAGAFNALHALSALAAAHAMGCDMALACASISGFEGAHRRNEYTGTVKGMLMYHDYGHNPAEMASALSVSKMQGRRLIAVMQPHTYSRVKGLFQQYLTCTRDADITLVTDIFAAREKDPGDINSQMLVAGMREAGIDARHTPGFDDVEHWLLTNGREGDLVLTMGCGDINLLNEQMQRYWDEAQ